MSNVDNAAEHWVRGYQDPRLSYLMRRCSNSTAVKPVNVFIKERSSDIASNWLWVTSGHQPTSQTRIEAVCKHSIFSDKTDRCRYLRARIVIGDPVHLINTIVVLFSPTCHAMFKYLILFHHSNEYHTIRIIDKAALVMPPEVFPGI